ncbi:MAG: cobalamin biosynthesis protein, partial [Janthinobacterium lividum]
MSGGVPFGLGVGIASSAAALVAGVLVDRWLGEPARAHPLVGFGRVAHALERRLNPRARARAVPSYVARMLGGLAWALAVLPPVALGWTLLGCLPGWAQWLAQVAMLWFALGG